MSASAPAADKQVGKSSLIPPEEQFWERYSPNNEAPLSGVSSTVIHILIICLIIGIIWVQNLLKVDEKDGPLEMKEPIRFSTAGGSPRSGSGPGDGGPESIGDNFNANEIPDTDVNSSKQPPKEAAELNPSKANAVKNEFGEGRWTEDAVKNPTQKLDIIAGVGAGARKQLAKAVGGQGGTGPGGGGKDVGKDVGEGGGQGAGKKGEPTKREKRNFRWAMTFNTRDGQDYLSQLIAFKAVLAIPINEEKGQFVVIRDLKNPMNGKEEDVSNLDRIYWIDDTPESVNQLFAALGRKAPAKFVVFLPKSIEERMLRLELAYTDRKYRTRDEDRIHETKFEVFKDGGTYDIRVREVYLVRGK